MNSKIIILFLFSLLYINTQAADTLRILHHKSYYPYAFVDSNGQSSGVLIDYWNLWAKTGNINIKFFAADEKDFIKKIEKNEVDLIAGVAYTDTFVAAFDYTEYIIGLNTILFLKKKFKPKTIYEINLPVLFLDNYNTRELISTKYPNLKTKACKNNKQLKSRIDSEKYSGFIYDFPNLLRGSTKMKISKDYYSFITLSSNRLRPAVKKGNSELRDLIITTSVKINDKDLLLIADKWEFIKKEHSYFWIIFSLIFLLVSLIVIFIVYLKKQNYRSLQIANSKSSDEWQVIINKGENDSIEFKSSLRWDFRQEKPNKTLEMVIAKTISAFLNANGGMLFIGVNDDGNIIGLEKDYQSLSKKNQDGFLLAITNLINQTLGKSTHKFLTINIISINNKDVCIVTAEKSSSPVFLGKGDKEEFYIRAAASSQPLSIREAYKYISNHWDN